MALEEGANEEPAQPTGGLEATLDTLLRNVGAVAHFVTEGRDELRQLLAAVLVWRQAHHHVGGIAVDTQTTDAGEEPEPGDDLSGPVKPRPGDPSGMARWIPPLGMEQWSGSVPTPDDPQSQPAEPTDDDLVQALEEYERQQAEEALQMARGDDHPGETLPDSEGEPNPEPGEHRRRRMLAAGTDP